MAFHNLPWTAKFESELNKVGEGDGECDDENETSRQPATYLCVSVGPRPRSELELGLDLYDLEPFYMLE
jgi:hypothetical protein